MNKNFFNQTKPLIYAKNLTKSIWLRWLKLLIDVKD
jgi:hypothetical protein